MSDRENFFPDPVAVFSHTVQVEREKMGLDLLQQCGKPIEMLMAVMKIVNDAHVGNTVLLQLRDDFNLVLSLAARSALAFASPLAARAARSDVMAPMVRWTAMSCSGVAPPALRAD